MESSTESILDTERRCRKRCMAIRGVLTKFAREEIPVPMWCWKSLERIMNGEDNMSKRAFEKEMYDLRQTVDMLIVEKIMAARGSPGGCE